MESCRYGHCVDREVILDIFGERNDKMTVLPRICDRWQLAIDAVDLVT